MKSSVSKKNTEEGIEKDDLAMEWNKVSHTISLKGSSRPKERARGKKGRKAGGAL